MPIELPTPQRCAFCHIAGDSTWAAIVEEGESTWAFLNPRQGGLGALLVVPKEHKPTILDLDIEEATAVIQHVHRLAQALRDTFDPSGLNIFQNNGVTAGQTVPHYHVHIVPTYPGDPPGKIFSSAELERTSKEDLLKIADKIIAHLPPRP